MKKYKFKVGDCVSMKYTMTLMVPLLYGYNEYRIPPAVALIIHKIKGRYAVVDYLTRLEKYYDKEVYRFEINLDCLIPYIEPGKYNVVKCNE